MYESEIGVQVRRKRVTLINHKKMILLFVISEISISIGTPRRLLECSIEVLSVSLLEMLAMFLHRGPCSAGGLSTYTHKAKHLNIAVN